MFSLLISVDKAAEAIGLGRSKTCEFIRAGDIQTAKLGGRRLVLVSSLEEFIKRNAEQPYNGKEDTK